MEIELKLICDTDALGIFEDKIIDILNSESIQVSPSIKNLHNEYFDTPERLLSKRKMSLRVRSNNQQYEQTIKTQGQVKGGLHQRPEYNVDIDTPQFDLTKFDPQIWPDDFDAQHINQQLESLFVTEFERHSFELLHKDFKMEVVFDRGYIKHQQDSIDICEIELELNSGNVSHLFDVAELLAAHIPTRISDVSKAARGFQLMHGNKLEFKRLPQFLPLQNDDSTEDAFCKLLQVGLSHWQYNQMVYEQTLKLGALNEIRESLMHLLQGVALYLPVLQCKELLDLHKQLLRLTQSWAWQEQLESLRSLRSRKGPFSKRIPKNQNLMNYLMGRREGLLLAHKPERLNMSILSSKVQIAASRILVERPWQTQNSGADIAVKKHAHGWLSQTWQTVLQSLPSNSAMDEKQYLALEVVLKQSLINGFLLADLFADSRGQFRAPWQDLLTGITELKALRLLKESLNDIEEKSDFVEWIQDKTHAVIKVMEQTRSIAISAETYW